MSDKPNWLKATRTVGGEEVINLRLAKGHGDWYYGKPHFAGEIRRNGFLYSCAWSIESGKPVEQFSNYPAQALDPASITEPEAVCVPDEWEGLDFSVMPRDGASNNGAPLVNWRGGTWTCQELWNFRKGRKPAPSAPAKPVVKVGQVWLCGRSDDFCRIERVDAKGNGNGEDTEGFQRHVRADNPNWTLVSDAPQTPTQATQAAMAEYVLKRDADILEKLKESEMRDASQAALDGETRPVDAETAAREFQEKYGTPEAEWAPGDKCSLDGEAHVVLGVDDGMAWVKSLEDHTYQMTAVWALKAPAPKTREVVKQVWLCAEWNNEEGWYVTSSDPKNTGAVVIAGPVPVAFPGVPVEVDDE